MEDNTYYHIAIVFPVFFVYLYYVHNYASYSVLTTTNNLKFSKVSYSIFMLMKQLLSGGG